MALEIDSSFRVLGAGDTIAIEVDGPTMADCLARAVEGFASCFAEVHPSIATELQALNVHSAPDDAPQLLRALLEGIVAFLEEGQLAIGLDATGDHLVVEVVPLTALQLVRPVPAKLDWHDVALGATEHGWWGRAVALTPRG